MVFNWKKTASGYEVSIGNKIKASVTNDGVYQCTLNNDHLLFCGVAQNRDAAMFTVENKIVMYRACNSEIFSSTIVSIKDDEVNKDTTQKLYPITIKGTINKKNNKETIVTIRSKQTDVIFHYTLNGRDPNKDTPIYNNKFIVENGNNTIVKAIGIKQGYFDSDIAQITIS